MHSFVVYVCKNFSMFTTECYSYALIPTLYKNQNNVLPAFYEKAVFDVVTNPILIMGLSSNAVFKAKSNTT